ncbi:B3/B4 domain-containing protein [Kordiimonas pumila]|uniref:B3/4 domain-containing protein n=1 Tax=Kordiimonas pumila TaxID=2161677 RepID=A0ABV7D0N6_9PROT|nr:phenylalanine--tRNA ligase beta subunit-related protein [Kordiimonas pumila]
MTLKIDEKFSKLGLETHIGILDFEVEVGPSGPALLAAMEDGAETRMNELLGEAASTDPVIAGVRAAFKSLGKDPSRYRPSSEALTRRVLSGKALYHVNNVVDSGNLISLMTGLPIGCYDAAWIKGPIEFRVGMPGETYDGIGRGDVNLENLPVLADTSGAFGSPFSDSGRTAVGDRTKNLKFVIYGLNVDVAHVEAAAEMADMIISRFCAPD